MSPKPSFPLESDSNSLLEVQRRQLAEKLGYLLAREWLRRRADCRSKLENSSSSADARDGGMSNPADAVGQTQSLPPAQTR